MVTVFFFFQEVSGQKVIVDPQQKVIVNSQQKVIVNSQQKVIVSPHPKATGCQMAELHEKLAQALTQLKELSGDAKKRILKSAEFDRVDRERLMDAGYLSEVINGWLMVTKPDARPGDTVAWYSSYWEFVREYLNDRFEKNWILSPEISISLLAENFNVPMQLVVQSPGASNRPVELPAKKSIFAYRTKLPKFAPADKNGLRIYPAAEALAAASPTLWTGAPLDVLAVLGSIRSTSQLLSPLLRDANVAAAGRIAGALAKIGRQKDADDIVKTMAGAGYQVRTVDPLERPVPMQISRPALPVVTRTKLLWTGLRDQVLQEFTDPPRIINDREAYMASVDELYVSDAYHSLSIEGYHVTEELIERVKSGNWNPSQIKSDWEQYNALAARGYWQAFQKVREAVEEIIAGGNAAQIVEANIQTWYRELFAPSAAAGLIPAERLAGWRQHPVFLQNSAHVPVSWEALPDATEAYFDCLREEPDPRVQAVLGHFVFTWIHPMPDGNGRCGRFIMNCMLASAGFPWTVVPVGRRDEYLKALEAASERHDIKPLSALIFELSKLQPPAPTQKQNARVAPGEMPVPREVERPTPRR
jgi:Fic/DOC family